MEFRVNFNHKGQAVNKNWLSQLSGGQEVHYSIHSGNIRSAIEVEGTAFVSRAGRRYLELSGCVFEGQISRSTGRGEDGRGRTIVLSRPTTVAG